MMHGILKYQRAPVEGTVSKYEGTRFHMDSDDEAATIHLACTRMTIYFEMKSENTRNYCHYG
jgi:hypothetical protein